MSNLHRGTERQLYIFTWFGIIPTSYTTIFASNLKIIYVYNFLRQLPQCKFGPQDLTTRSQGVGYIGPSAIQKRMRVLGLKPDNT